MTAGGMGMGTGGMGMGARHNSPPPAPLDDRARSEYVPEGTASSDGMGATVRAAPTAEAYTEKNVTYLPWKDGSKINPLAARAALSADTVVMSKDGSEFNLNAAVSEQPTVLIYYRGGWCPLCNAHFTRLTREHSGT